MPSTTSMWSSEPVWEAQASATWAPRSGTPDCIDARDCSGLSVERARMGVVMSPSWVTTMPSAARTTAAPMCRDSTNPLRSTTASSTADSTVNVACEFSGIAQVYGAGFAFPGPVRGRSALLHRDHDGLPAGGAVRHRIRPFLRLHLAGTVRGTHLDVVRPRLGVPVEGPLPPRDHRRLVRQDGLGPVAAVDLDLHLGDAPGLCPRSAADRHPPGGHHGEGFGYFHACHRLNGAALGPATLRPVRLAVSEARHLQ